MDNVMYEHDPWDDVRFGVEHCGGCGADWDRCDCSPEVVAAADAQAVRDADDSYDSDEAADEREARADA